MTEQPGSIAAKELPEIRKMQSLQVSVFEVPPTPRALMHPDALTKLLE
jgi:hypothetical protein